MNLLAPLSITELWGTRRHLPHVSQVRQPRKVGGVGGAAEGEGAAAAAEGAGAAAGAGAGA